MKRTAFRLQSVLELRQVQERAAGAAAAEAAHRAALGARHAAEVDSALGARSLPTGGDGATFLAAVVGLHTLAGDAAQAHSAAIATAEQADAVRAAWTAAAQRTAALDKLAQRHRLAAARAERAAEERAIDDLVTGRYRTRTEEDPWTE